MASKLIPKTVHLQADLKMIHSYQYTSGSGLGITFEIPEGMTGKELTDALHEEQQRLAKFATVSEFLRGSMDQSELENRLEAIKNGYGRLKPSQRTDSENQN